MNDFNSGYNGIIVYRVWEMKKLIVGVLGAIALIGCTNGTINNETLNEELMTEISEQMTESKICQDSSLSPTLTETMVRFNVCSEYIEKQTKLFHQIQDAKSNRERQRYRKASNQLLKDTIAALSN